MKVRNRFFILTILAFSALLGPACDHPSDFPQYSRDVVQTYGLFAGMADLFNSTLAEQPTGSHNFTADCPQGGSVHIEGSTSAASGAEIDVTYDMSDCRILYGGSEASLRIELKLNGVMHHLVNYDANGLGSETLSAQNLHMEGMLRAYPDEASIDQECDLELTYVETETSVAMLGRLCDRDVGFSLWHVTGE